jgi:hypothetical protein
LRTRFAVVMPVFIALFMWLTVAHAEGDGNTLVTLTGESSAVKVGESFTVEIKAKDVSDLYGIEFQLAYDRAKFEMKGFSMSEDYEFFGGGNEWFGQSGINYYPLIRKNIRDTERKPSVTLASFEFVSKQAGTGEIRLVSAAAVSSEQVFNEFGYKDMTEIPLTVEGSITLSITEPTTGSAVNPGPFGKVLDKPYLTQWQTQPYSVDSAHQLIKLLSDRQVVIAESAAAELPSVIDNLADWLLTISAEQWKDAAKLPELVRERLETVRELRQEAQRHRLAIAPHNDLLIDAVVLGETVKFSEPFIKLMDDYNSGIRFQLTDFSEESADKLGLYALDEKTGRWRYMANAKKDSTKNRFRLETVAYRQYAILRYDMPYRDIGHVNKQTRQAIERLSRLQLLEGKSESRFAPDDVMTRAQFAKMITLVFGLQREPYSDSFADVHAGQWHADYVAAAHKAGIIQGYNGRFAPDEAVSREQMAVMMMRAYAISGMVPEFEEKSFKDEDRIADWARSAVHQAKALGLIDDADSVLFRPSAKLTRSEAAVIFANMLDILDRAAEKGEDAA